MSENNPATLAKSSTGRTLWNTVKGLAKVGFACAVLLMMTRIDRQLDDIGFTAYTTQRKFDDVHKLLTPSEEKQEVVMTAASVGNAGGGSIMPIR